MSICGLFTSSGSVTVFNRPANWGRAKGHEDEASHESIGFRCGDDGTIVGGGRDGHAGDGRQMPVTTQIHLDPNYTDSGTNTVRALRSPATCRSPLPPVR